MDRRGDLVLPPVEISAALARFLRRQPRFHPPRKPPQRGDAVRRGWPEGPVGFAHQLRLGRAGAGQPRARHVCVGRRAHQLPDRHRLSRHDRRQGEILAGGYPSDRQGHRSLSRSLLAGVPAVGGHPAAQERVRSRLPAHARREDVEVGWQRRRSDGTGRRVRRRCAALFLPPRGELRPGRQLFARGDRNARQRRARQQLRQLGAADLVVHRQELGRRVSHRGYGSGRRWHADRGSRRRPRRVQVGLR